MALSQVSLSREVLPTMTRQESQEVVWQGKKVHNALSNLTDRILVCVGIIMVIAGGILLPQTELGINIILLGALLSGIGFFCLYRGNPLEKALIHLIGSKEKLQNLPAVKRSVICIHPKKDKMINYYDREKVLWVKPEAMTSNMMRVTEKGKTIGVAFKYLKCSLVEPDKTKIRVYFFQPPKENPNAKVKSPSGNYKSTDNMFASEGNLLEAMIKKNRFIQDAWRFVPGIV